MSTIDQRGPSPEQMAGWEGQRGLRRSHGWAMALVYGRREV